MSESNYITIKGAKVNNLKNIDVDIPRDKLVVITGLSGPESHHWLSTRFTPKGNGATWKAFHHTPASFWEEWENLNATSSRESRQP